VRSFIESDHLTTMKAVLAHYHSFAIVTKLLSLIFVVHTIYHICI